MITIARLTPEEKARLRPQVLDMHNDVALLQTHIRDDSSVRLIREDLEAVLKGASKALSQLPKE